MSENKEKEGTHASETYEMLKSLYDFKAVYPKTISFEEGEYFMLHQTSTRQRNWWSVVSRKGQLGFVPSNYVFTVAVEPSFIVGFLESAIETLRHSTENEINGIIAREDLIKSLESKKAHLDRVIEADAHGRERPKRDRSPRVANGAVMGDAALSDDLKNDVRQKLPTEVPPKMSKKSTSSPSMGGGGKVQPPEMIQESPSMGALNAKASATEESATIAASPHDNSVISEASEAGTTATTTTTTSDEMTTISKVEPKGALAAAEEGSGAETNIKNEVMRAGQLAAAVAVPVVEMKIDATDVYEIVDAIRKNTNLSHDLSCSVLRVVLSELEAILPETVTPYLEPIAVHLTANLPAPDAVLGQTHDAQRLRIIFSELADYKSDSEQRNWMLYEDEADIKRYLSELITILTDADSKICLHEMADNQYQAICNLVLYYQMETRWPIRKLLLRAFRAMCHLDFIAVDILLGSVLPLELVQDMISNPRNLELLQELSTMLTIIFCIGRKVPIQNQEHLRADFIIFLFNIIENPAESSEYAEIVPDLMSLILSFNLQFDNDDENVVIEALQQIQGAKTFTEKLLLLVNREEDPVNLLKHTPPPISSVLKMLIDMFNLPITAGLFYTNDCKVLVDIIVRQLSDLSAGEGVRKHYLELCRRIIRNTNYAEHGHRKQDLLKIFTRIFCEDTEVSGGDQQICREIANEFPHIFKA